MAQALSHGARAVWRSAGQAPGFLDALLISCLASQILDGLGAGLYRHSAMLLLGFSVAQRLSARWLWQGARLLGRSSDQLLGFSDTRQPGRLASQVFGYAFARLLCGPASQRSVAQALSHGARAVWRSGTLF